MMLKRPFLSAIVLAVLMWVALGFLKSHLPYGPARAAFFDALAFPGALIASIPYPQGIHTGHGAAGWGWAVVISNLLIYLLFWYLCLKIIGRIRGSQHRYDAVDIPVRRG